MRPASLLVLAQGFQSVPSELLSTFEAQLSEREEPLGAVKPHEADSVVRLVKTLRDGGAQRMSLFEGFVFSFRIPQISSEFDLLKISDDAVVNIELKSESVGTRRIGEQLARNRHYLSPLERTVHTFSFVSDTGQLFERGDGGSTHRVDPRRLIEVLGHMGNAYEGQVEDLFRVSNYLVSPLNNAHKFLKGHYFLTNHQAQIRASFLRSCAHKEGPVPTFMVYGSAGTGKSLLLYDLARSWEGARPACVIHCGVLCAGHETLNNGQSAFRIISAMRSERADLTAYGSIFVDEAQRMWPSQLKRIVSVAASKGIPLYLSLDRRQVLPHDEDAFDIEKIVREMLPHTSAWELSRKIRTNRELVDFIRALFDLRGAERYSHTNHVKVACAQDLTSARELVDALRHEGHQFISLGNIGPDAQSSTVVDVPGAPDPYAVIGQEFDKVVMAVGPSFSLGEQRHRQLLYQGLTRARGNIALVVYDNDVLLRKLLAML